MRARSPILLPPPAQAPRPLPGWLAFVALAGLAVLVCSTVPAVLNRTRLTRDLDQLQDQVVRQERRVRELEQRRRAAQEDTFAYEQALRCLVQPGSSDPTQPR